MQPFPHRSWKEESEFLDNLFGFMDDGPRAIVLVRLLAPGVSSFATRTLDRQPADSLSFIPQGKPGRGLMWHMYTAENTRRPCPPSPTSVMTSISMCSLNGAISSDDDTSGSDVEVEAPVEPVTYTMEVCMTELCDKAAANFFHGAVGTTAAEVTDASGALRVTLSTQRLRPDPALVVPHAMSSK